MTLVLLKLLLAPILVVSSSLAGRRWGQNVTGTLVAIPIVAGPILLLATLEHGADFGARAANAALLGLVALAVFVVVFVWVSRFCRWQVTLAAASIACLIADVGLSTLTAAPAIGLVMALMAFALAIALTPVVPSGHRATSATPPVWDLPARAVATAILVLTLTGVSGALGPNLTGVLAPFPVATSILAAFVHAQGGSRDVAVLLRGFLIGAFGYITFCFLLAVLLRPLGVALAFSVALGVAAAMQLITLWLRIGRRGDGHDPSRSHATSWSGTPHESPA